MTSDTPPSALPPDLLNAPPRLLLRAIPWLESVASATLDRLAAQALVHRVPAGSMIFEQAETPSFATFVLGGRVEMMGVRGTEEVLIEIISPIDILLPAAVLNRQPYLLRARMLDDAHLLLIPADAFRQAVVTDHALCLAVLALQAAHFRREVKHAKNIHLRSAEDRVGCFLLRLAEGAAGPVRLPFEKRLIASQLGMTRETFSRALAQMPKFGLRVDGDQLTVEDAAAAAARFPLDPLIDGPEPINTLPPATDAAADVAGARKRPNATSLSSTSRRRR